jgi:hypothetical protein
MASAWLARVRRLNAHNLTTFRDAPLAEISGSLGDLGTLLPLMIALAAKGYIDLGSTLVFSGVFNVLTGVVFGIPLPEQPMKVCHVQGTTAITTVACCTRTNMYAMWSTLYPLDFDLGT